MDFCLTSNNCLSKLKEKTFQTKRKKKLSKLKEKTKSSVQFAFQIKSFCQPFQAEKTTAISWPPRDWRVSASWGPIKSPPEGPNRSQHYRIEGLKEGAFNWAP